MKRLLCFVLFMIAACTPSPQDTSAAITFTAPQPVSPDDGIEFIDSDVTVAWDWPQLEPHQRFALRVWFAEEAPQELWLQTNEAQVQTMIDSTSRAFGPFHWKVAVVNTDESGGFASMGSEWSDIRTLNRVRRYTLQPLPSATQSDMARYVASQGFSTTFDIANFTRDYVHTYTNITQQGKFGADFSDAMQMVYNHSQGLGDAPQLYCDGMSTGILTVVLELGIESRLVYLYGDTRGWIGQHTFLEVFNTQTQQWEVQDPTFNLYFVDIETGERAGVERMVFGNLETLVGCNTLGDCNRSALRESVERYLGAFRRADAPDEVWVNPNRFNISERVSGLENNNFPEFVSRLTGIAQRDLIFRFDSWEPISPAEAES